MFGRWRRETTRINRHDPLSYDCEITYDFAYRRDGWDVRTETRATTQVTKDEFIFHTDLDAFENGERIFSRSITRRASRDFG